VESRSPGGGSRWSSTAEDAWHWTQFCRSGCDVRRPGLPVGPWQEAHSERICSECGMVGGAPGHARAPPPAEAFPTKRLAGVSGYGASGFGATATTWH